LGEDEHGWRAATVRRGKSSREMEKQEREELIVDAMMVGMMLAATEIMVSKGKTCEQAVRLLTKVGNKVMAKVDLIECFEAAMVRKAEAIAAEKAEVATLEKMMLGTGETEMGS